MKSAYCFIICICLLSCEKDFYGKTGELITYSYGVWRLEKMVTPSKTILAKDLGYEKILEIKPEKNDIYFYGFKDKKEEFAYPLSTMSNEVDKKDRIYFEVLSGAYKIKLQLTPTSSGNFSLMTSDFIHKTSDTDSVRYYYHYYGSERGW